MLCRFGRVDRVDEWLEGFLEGRKLHVVAFCWHERSRLIIEAWPEMS